MGIRNGTHEIVGTAVNYQKDFRKEPLQHYLARQLTPDICFSFSEIALCGRRVVVLDIPAAKRVPTSFDGVRYIRIGSGKENVSRYPEREAQLFSVLATGFPSVESTESEYQNLTFVKLFTYYAGRGINLREENFRKNLGLLTADGKYNLMAQLLSDDCHMPIRVSVFKGTSKADPLFSVKEFGNTCVLLALNKILEYGDAINVIMADESNRITERREVALFSQEAFREALINAFVHNKWVDGNAPMITVFSNRIEILSRGAMAPAQTVSGFFLGESVPVNQKLSDLFLQLHICERSGRGVPVITDAYGRNAFEFRENSIVVTLPFAKPPGSEPAYNTPTAASGNVSGTAVKHGRDRLLNQTQKRIMEEIRRNPGITQAELSRLTGIGKTTVQNCISMLKECGFIKREGANKRGCWIILEQLFRPDMPEDI